MIRDALIFLSENTLARRMSKVAPGARTLARRFVAGETVEDGIIAARTLNRAGLSVSLDYLGESVSRPQDAAAAADTYCRVLDGVAAGRLNANVSLKLTQLGQDIDAGFLQDNVRRVLERARAHDNFVRFDMESSRYTQATLDFFHQCRDQGWLNAGVVLQSYLRRSQADARALNEMGARVRLCKGAYQEPADVAFQEKHEVDAAFIRLMQLLLEEGNYPGIATHDPAMIRATTEFAAQRRIPPGRFEFQMLFGVRRDLQHQLRAQGYNLRVYVPFGEAWYPYLMRRMAERPANLLFVVNAVLAESPLRFLTRRNNRT